MTGGADWYVSLACNHTRRVWTTGANIKPGSGGTYYCMTCRETVRVLNIEQVRDVGPREWGNRPIQEDVQ